MARGGLNADGDGLISIAEGAVTVPDEDEGRDAVSVCASSGLAWAHLTRRS